MNAKTNEAIDEAAKALRVVLTWNDTLGDTAGQIREALKLCEAAQAERLAPLHSRPESLAKRIATAVAARLNCIKSGNSEWKENHESDVESYCREFMPSGSGFDAGTTLDFDASTAEKLVFVTSFH